MSHINPPLDDEILETKALDRNWFIGAYVTRAVKLALQAEAKEADRTVSKQLTRILAERYNQKGDNENGNTKIQSEPETK